MTFDDFKALREQVRAGAFHRQQLAELLGDVVRRLCGMEHPELEEVQHDLSECCEALDVALDNVDARESRFRGPDPCDLARDAAIAASEVHP